jgi:hypothetical protein
LRTFIAESARAANAAQVRAQRLRRTVLTAVSAAAGIFFAATVLSGWQYFRAERARQFATEQEAIAKTERDRAEKQTVNAKQKSALLAAAISKSLTDEGALDEALLLLLDASTTYDNHTAPDQIRIALTRALEKKDAVETKILFPNLQYSKRMMH